MNEEQKESLARSLEGRVDMLPYLPELLEGMWALGSSPDLYVEMLKPLNLPPETTAVVDLGCGKGAVTITLAKELGFKAQGVDLCQPFIEEAKVKAAEYGVDDLCHFRIDDIREFVKEGGDFDVAVYASLGNILGGFDECVKAIRGIVRAGGYIIIDDGFLKHEEPIERQGYEYYYSRQETVRLLTSQGDEIIEERIYSDEATKAINDEYMEIIRRNSERLIEKYPQNRESFEWYIRNQEQMCEVIEVKMTGAA